MANPIKLEILSLVPVTFKQCSHCERFYDQSGIGEQVHKQILAEYPQEMLEDHLAISNLVVELINRFGDDIAIHVIDPQSLTGILKSLRYRIHQYPTFIVNSQELIIGWDLTRLEQVLESRFTLQKTVNENPI